MFLNKTELLKRILIGEKVLIKVLSQFQHNFQLDMNLKLHLEAFEKRIDHLLKSIEGSKEEGGIEEQIRNYLKMLESIKDIVNIRREAIKFCCENVDKVQGYYDEYDCEPIFLDQWDLENLQPCAYEMRLGMEVYVTTERLPKILKGDEKDTFKISPGEFAVLTTLEYLCVPRDLVALISIRYRFKEQGLINVSGFHVDPGFHGKLLFTVYNAGPQDIVLRYNERMFIIMFAKLTNKTEPYRGGRKGQTRIPMDAISRLSGPSVSVRSLSRRIERLETYLYLLAGALITAVLAAVLRLILG